MCGIKDGKEVKEYKQIAALGVYAGEITEENEKVMLSGVAKGLITFLNYFIFGALDKFGKHDYGRFCTWVIGTVFVMAGRVECLLICLRIFYA